MGYIYHIYSLEDPQTIYIGQSSHGQYTNEPTSLTSVSGNRVLEHFGGLYDSKHESAEFLSWLKKHPLNTIQVEIYDEASNYGIDDRYFQQFFDIWGPKGLNPNVSIKYQETQKNVTGKKITSKYKLDAAEILHIYHFYKKGCNLLNHQMGGSTYWVAIADGRVLNREMTVSDLVNMVDSDSKIISSLQDSFNTSWKSLWASGNKKIRKKITSYFIDNILTAKKKNSSLTGEVKKTQEELLKIVSEYVWDNLKKIQNTLQGRVNGVTVVLNPLTEGLYSKHKNYTQLFEHWNIVSLVTATIKKKKRVKGLEGLVSLFSTDLKKELQSTIDDILGEISNLNVSYANFFTMEYKSPTGNELKSHIINNKNFTIKKCSPAIIELYRRSLKRMSYFYFSKIAKETKSLVESSWILPPYSLQLDSQNYSIAVFRNTWSSSIEHVLRSKADFFTGDFLYEYVRQCLTIFAQNNPSSVPAFNKSPTFNSFPQGNYGIFNVTGKNSAVPWAIPFSDETYDLILEWLDAKLVDLKIY